MSKRDQAVRLGALAAMVGGWAWVVKFAVIAARDTGFEPLEGVAYMLGLLGPIGGVVAYLALTGRRLAFAALLAPAAIVATVALGAVIQELVNSVYTGGNLAGTTEIGILLTGVLWLLAGLTLRARRLDPVHAPLAEGSAD